MRLNPMNKLSRPPKDAKKKLHLITNYFFNIKKKLTQKPKKWLNR